MKTWLNSGAGFEGYAADPAQLEPVGDTVEAHLLDINTTESAVDGLMHDVSSLEQDTRALEQLNDVVVPATLEGEQLNDVSARVIDVAIEALTNRWVPAARKAGVESYRPAKRGQAACESIGEKLNDMWTAFVKWIKELINNLKDFWVKYINVGKSFQKRADKFRARMDKGLGEVETRKIGGKWLKGILVNDEVNIKTDLDITAIAKGCKAKIDDAKQITAHGIKSGFKKPIELGAKTNKSVGGALPSGATLERVGALPSNWFSVQYTMPERFGTLSCVDLVRGGEGKVAERDIPTPGEPEINTAIETLEALGMKLEKDIVEFRESNEKLKELEEAVEEARKKAADSKAEERTELQKAARAAKRELANWQAIRKVATVVAPEYGHGLCGYIEAAIAAHKKAD